MKTNLANIHGSSFLQIGPRCIHNINVVYLVPYQIKKIIVNSSYLVTQFRNRHLYFKGLIYETGLTFFYFLEIGLFKFYLELNLL